MSRNAMPNANSLAGPLGDVADTLLSAIPAFLRHPAGRRAKVQSAKPTEAGTRAARMGTPLFTGTPVFSGRDAVLVDTSRSADAGKLPSEGTFSRLIVSLGIPQQDAVALDPGQPATAMR